MSWKTNILAIAVLGLLTSGVMAEGRDARHTISGAAVVDAASADPVSVAEPTDQELIEKQKTCPVMDKPLGSMGKPVKVVVKERTVFLCCAGCKKKLLADPDKYLKKLDEKK